MTGSVRARLTAAVVGVTAGLTIAAALLAPKVVHSALVDDRLDAEVVTDAQTLATRYAIDHSTVSSAELTAFFAPEVADLVSALLPTGTIDRLRAYGDHHLRVALAGRLVADVPPDGPIRVDVVVAAQTIGPVVTIDRLRSLASELQVGGVPPPPFEMLGEDGVDIDDYLAQVSDELGIDLDQWIDPQVLDALPEIAGDLTWLEEVWNSTGPTGSPGGVDAVVVAAPDDYAYGIRRVDGVDVVVAARTGGIEQSVDRVRHVLWLSVPLAMLLAGTIAWMLAGRALAPVAAITERTRSIRSGTLHERVPVPASRDEVAALAVEMNEMLDRVQREDVRRRQFVADASHELRSPIAAIRAQAEAALATTTDPETAELAAGVLAEAERMSGLVDDLLSLARHDEGLAPPVTVHDLDDLVLAEARRPRRVPIDTSAVSAGRVRGRADELTRVVTHLLDNAARHARSAVTVGLRADGSTVTLTVDDDGPGVPVGERDRVFERFVRLDEARRRDTGGAGLGLSVVATVVTASGGTYRIEDSDLGGARFVIELPTAA